MNDETLKKRLYHARLNALMNANYHAERRRFLENANRTITFLIVILGASSIADLISINEVYKIPDYPILSAAIITILSASQLVFDFGRRARDHQLLQGDYSRLLSEIESARELTESKIVEWNGRVVSLGASELPAKQAILSLSSHHIHEAC